MKERVQLNLSVTREQKLALQALAEGHGTSVTRLVLDLIEVPEVAAVVVERQSPGDERCGVVEAVGETLRVIKSPGEVPAAVERVAPSRTSEFTPYSKEQSAGKVQKKRGVKLDAAPWDPCRHGLMRCKVCGTG